MTKLILPIIFVAIIALAALNPPARVRMVTVGQVIPNPVERSVIVNGEVWIFKGR